MNVQRQPAVDPVGLVEHPLPHQRRHVSGQRVRDDQQRAVDLAAAHPHLVEHDRQQQPEREADRHRDDGEHEVPGQDARERPLELVVREHLAIVREPDAGGEAGAQLGAVLGDEEALVLVIDDARRDVGDRPGIGVVDARRRALDGLAAGDRDRRVLGLARHHVEVRISREAGQRTNVAGAHTGVVAHRLDERPSRRRQRRDLGVGEVELGQLGLGSEEELLGLGVVEREAGEQSVGIRERGHVVTRRPLHRLHRLALDLVDRLRPGEHVARAVVGRRRVRRVQHRVEGEDDEEEHPRQEVLHRHEAPRQVGHVEGDERDEQDGDVAPRLVVDRRDHAGDRHCVGGAERQDLDDPARRGPAPAPERRGLRQVERRRPGVPRRRHHVGHLPSRRSRTECPRRRR